MDYQEIAQLFKQHAICLDEAEYLVEFVQHNSFISNCKWFLIRSTTIHKIISGDIEQTKSPMVNAFTLSNNISRRAMEFIITPPPPPTLLENDEEYVYEVHQDEDDEANNNHVNYDYDNHDDEDDAARYYRYYENDDDYRYAADI